MKYFYDQNTDSLYLTLVEAGAYEDSIEAAPGVVLDFDARGRLVGLDIEHASKKIDVTDLELHEEPASSEASITRVDGNNLKKEREKLGLTQSELSQKLNVSPNTVARWERGELKIEHPGMLQLALRAIAFESSRPQDAFDVPGIVVVRGKSARPRVIARNSKTAKLPDASSLKPAFKSKPAARTSKKR